MKINKKNNRLLLLILLTLFIVGCQFIQKKGPSQTISETEFRKGSEGLVMNFLENAPPKELYEESLFKAILRLENKGASGISNGFLSLGIEEDYMDLLYSDFVKQFNLDGKSIYNPIGNQRTEEYSLRTKKIDVQSEAHKSSILATACYDYSTVFSPSICIDTDVYKERRIKKACEVKDISASNQGAPVAVTLIEEKLLPQSDRIVVPNFIIHITNVGNGKIVDKNKIEEACSSGSFDRASWNYVYVEAFLGEQQLVCEPSEEDSDTGYVKIKDKEGSVRCRLEGGIGTNLASYTTTLSINVTYGYTFTVSKEILIKKSRII